MAPRKRPAAEAGVAEEEGRRDDRSMFRPFPF